MSRWPTYYILVGRMPVAVDMLTWAKWFEKLSHRRVAEDKLGNTWISTVFLGLDHSFGDGDPVLFETMVFGGPLDGEMWRYVTYAQAERGHAEAVRRARHAADQIKAIAEKAGART